MAFVFLGATAVLGLGACGQEKRDPQVQYGDPTPAKLTYSDMPWWDFGSRAVSSVHEKLIAVTNAGTTPATQLRGSFYASVHFSFKGGTFPGEGGTCSDTLGGGEVCKIVVAFSPQYSGSFEQPVTLLFFDGSKDQRSTGPYLRGEGI